jgi:hypothetical protein
MPQLSEFPRRPLLGDSVHKRLTFQLGASPPVTKGHRLLLESKYVLIVTKTAGVSGRKAEK